MGKRAALLVSGLFTVLGACLSDLNSDVDGIMTDAASANGGNGGDAGGDSGANSGNDANGNSDANSGQATNGAANGGTTNNNTSGNNGTTTNNGNGTSTSSGTNAGGSTSSGSSSSGGANGTTSTGSGSSSSGGQDASVPSRTPVFVAVGYEGRRVYSTDLGMTWSTVNDGFNGGSGDDTFALRAVSYGHGQFIAGGWKILTSTDGKTWTDRKGPQTQWIGGIQIAANGRLVATGGYGYSTYSDDALNWKLGGVIGANAASRSLAYGNGTFVSAADGGNWWSSSDGTNWTMLSAGHDDRPVVFCDGAFKADDTCTSNYIGKRRAQGEGVTVRVNAGKLERSTNGTTFSAVGTQGANLEDVVFGYAP